MQIIRRGYVDDVDIFALDNAAPVGRDFLPAPGGGHLLQAGAVSAADHFQLRLVCGFEEVVDLRVGVGMGAAHEALSDDGDVELFHAMRYCSSLSCRSTMPKPGSVRGEM